MKRSHLCAALAGGTIWVMQSLAALADSTFNYNMRAWGPAQNGAALAQIRTAPAAREAPKALP